MYQNVLNPNKSKTEIDIMCKVNSSRFSSIRVKKFIASDVNTMICFIWRGQHSLVATTCHLLQDVRTNGRLHHRCTNFTLRPFQSIVLLHLSWLQTLIPLNEFPLHCTIRRSIYLRIYWLSLTNLSVRSSQAQTDLSRICRNDIPIEIKA